MTLEELLKRPEICYNDLKEIDTNQPELPEAVTQQVEISIKYEGYIKRQLQQVEQAWKEKAFTWFWLQSGTESEKRSYSKA